MNFTLEINLGKETLDVLKQLIGKSSPAADKPVKEKVVKEEKTSTTTVVPPDPNTAVTLTDAPTKMTEAEVRAIVGPINKDADMDTKRKIKEEYLGGLALPEFVRVRSAEEVVAFVELVKALKK